MVIGVIRENSMTTLSEGKFAVLYGFIDEIDWIETSGKGRLIPINKETSHGQSDAKN